MYMLIATITLDIIEYKLAREYAKKIIGPICNNNYL